MNKGRMLTKRITLQAVRLLSFFLPPPLRQFGCGCKIWLTRLVSAEGRLDVVCLEPPVPAVHPKDKCSECRRRTHVVEYLRTHWLRRPSGRAPAWTKPHPGRRGPAAGRKLKSGGGGSAAPAGQDGGARAVLEQVGGLAGETDFISYRWTTVVQGIQFLCRSLPECSWTAQEWPQPLG